MSFLYGGTIVKIDLTHKKIVRESTSIYSKKFIGGRGTNSKIMFDNINPGIDPLSPENVIVFGLGPLTGTLCPSPSRVDIMSKSPVTGYLGDSNMGGHWPAELKFAGYDHLIIEGKSQSPVYISIDNDQIRILDGADIWGKDTYVSTKLIRRDLGDPDTKILCIGKAGEKKVSFASILSNVGNAAGRNGMGAVMGSKNLKAIAVRGTKPVRIADVERFFLLSKQLHELLKKSPTYDEYSKRGTMKSGTLSIASGYAPAGNVQDLNWKNKIDYLSFWEKWGVKRAGCFGCPVQCMETYSVPGIGSGVVSCENYVEPTVNVKNDDMMLWWEMEVTCQRHGVDVISISGILGWLMELYEAGVISNGDTDGIEMRWGNRDGIIKMTHKIIDREGIGDILADGFKQAIQAFGQKSATYAMHVKNSPIYVGGAQFPYIGLMNALGPRGDRMRAFVPFVRPVIRAIGDLQMSDQEKEKIIKDSQDLAERITGTKKAADLMGYEGKAKGLIHTETMVSMPDMLGICRYLLSIFKVLTPENQAEILSVGAGTKITAEELRIAAIRNRNVERSFEAREGLSRKDDTIPERLFNKDIGGAFTGVYIDRNDFERVKDEYYTLRGWNLESGIPTYETLIGLDLPDIADDLRMRKVIE